jgi:hypothetical protein
MLKTRAAFSILPKAKESILFLCCAAFVARGLLNLPYLKLVVIGMSYAGILYYKAT